MKTFAGFNYPKSIYQLPTPSNLEGVKKKRALRECCGPYYQDNPAQVTWAHPGGSFYLGSDFEPGRYIRRADEIIRLGHTGWYCDEFQEQTIFGIVIYLPHGKFLAGWSMGEGMASAYEGEIYDDETEAARAADQLAKATAEEELEYLEEQRELKELEERNQGADAEETEGY